MLSTCAPGEKNGSLFCDLNITCFRIPVTIGSSTFSRKSTSSDGVYELGH